MPSQKLKITLDTNTLPVDRALEALGDIPADVVVTTVTSREVHGTKWQPELSTLKVPEIWVMGESPMGVGALGRPSDAEVFEVLLDAISRGTFPKPASARTFRAVIGISYATLRSSQRTLAGQSRRRLDRPAAS